jgi:hypothetical protein
MSGYRGACARAIPLDARGDITDSDAILWRHDEGTPYVPSPIVVGGRVYFTAANTGVLTCLDAATGDPVYDRQRLPGLSNVYASPASAAGRIYLVGRDGATVVLRDGPTLDVLATNQLDEPIDASPAIVGRQLFLRGARHLYCIEDQTTAAIDRALSFLSTEVARWPAENGCFSCHNHGDGARALFTASRLGLAVDATALAESTAWLKQPERWQHQIHAREQLLLGVEPLDDRFHDPVHRRESRHPLVKAHGRDEAKGVGRELGIRFESPGALEAVAGGVSGEVEQQGRHAGVGAVQRDLSAHGTGTENRHGIDHRLALLGATPLMKRSTMVSACADSE